jgi:EXPERA (EXPanded EBP superfamily)
MKVEHIPLSKRPIDIILIAFFAINLFLVSYMIDIEQLVIANPHHFIYPLWPPGPVIDAIHWWENQFDPLLVARPVWYKDTIWLDNILYGPFYAVAIYAFIKGKQWIRIPSIIYATMMATGVFFILTEEAFGEFHTSHLAIVTLANSSWVIFPVIILLRMGLAQHPFIRHVPGPSTDNAEEAMHG